MISTEQNKKGNKMNGITKYYVARNLTKGKRLGYYILIVDNQDSNLLAFGLSVEDAVRASKAGIPYLGRNDAKSYIDKIKD